MFQLTDEEFANLKSQIVISSWGGSRRSKPYAFTEQGVAMLSSVLRSKRAVKVNIEIVRAFVQLRKMIVTHEELARKLSELETQFEGHDEKIQAIFKVIHELINPDNKPQKKIGFTVKEKQASYGKKSKKS